jgi:hypothetical protein
VLESAAHASLEDSKIHLRWAHRFLFDLYLDAIDWTLIDKIVAAGRNDGVAVATCNRLLEIIRVILRRRTWTGNGSTRFLRSACNPIPCVGSVG